MASVVSSADEVATQLVGTWKLTSWVTQVIGEDSREPYGPNPKGRLVITPEGHWIVIITAANQDQTRFFRVEGDKFDIRTPEIASAVLPGKKIVGTLCFERER